MKVQTNEQQEIIRVSTRNILLNAALSLFKLIVGLTAHSTIMVSEAIHTASDMLSTVLVMVSALVSRKPSDKPPTFFRKHLQSLVAMLLSALLFATGLGIGINALGKIRASSGGLLEAPGSMALLAAAISILLKEWMYRYTTATAKRIQSDVLMADALHHRTDALTYIGSFAGLLGARLGFPILDPLAGLVICVFIIKSALEIFWNAFQKVRQQTA